MEARYAILKRTQVLKTKKTIKTNPKTKSQQSSQVNTICNPKKNLFKSAMN